MNTHASLPSEDAAVVLLFNIVATGQIKLRRIAGRRRIATVLAQPEHVAGGMMSADLEDSDTRCGAQWSTSS